MGRLVFSLFVGEGGKWLGDRVVVLVDVVE